MCRPIHINVPQSAGGFDIVAYSNNGFRLLQTCSVRTSSANNIDACNTPVQHSYSKHVRILLNFKLQNCFIPKKNVT